MISDTDNEMTPFTRELMQELLSELIEINSRIARCNSRLRKICISNDVSKRLFSIPGVGVLAATAILASVPDPKNFKNGREFSAYLGLVPKQFSSGGKQRMAGISKRGDKYIRKLLIHGARAIIAYQERYEVKMPKKAKWIKELRQRSGFCKTAVALANKNARVCWAIMMSDGEFKYS